MDYKEFAYWLKGFFDISDSLGSKTLNETQVDMIKEHLALVFGEQECVEQKVDKPKEKSTEMPAWKLYQSTRGKRIC